MANHKIGDLVEVFFNVPGRELRSNRIQITDVIERGVPGKTTVIYTGVRVMDYARWKQFRDEKKISYAEALERDFEESQIGHNGTASKLTRVKS